MQRTLSTYVRGIASCCSQSHAVHVCSSHICLLSNNALSLRHLKGLWKRFIPGSNDVLKWQHTGAICAVWAPFVCNTRILFKWVSLAALKSVLSWSNIPYILLAVPRVSFDCFNVLYFQALAENASLAFVRPKWIFACHEKEAMIPFQRYLIVPPS